MRTHERCPPPVDVELHGFHAACPARAHRHYAGCVHNSFSLAGETRRVMRHTPAAPTRRAGAGSRSRRGHRPGPAPRPRVVDACAAMAGLGLGVAVGTVVIGESRGSLAASGGLLTAEGRLAGFTGAYLLLIMVLLVARLPWLERSVGQDRLIRWDRQVAPCSCWLARRPIGWTTPAAMPARTAWSGSASEPTAAVSASPSKTAAPASSRPNGRGCSTGSTARPSRDRARASGWPSATRSCAPPAAAGTSVTRRSAGH
jgi:hypothetical protein